MENIVLTNNKDLRLVSLKVGLLSTLRLEMPQIDAGATNVEVIVTLGEVHSAYSATYDSEGKKWVCDVLPQQFRAVGKQSYEIAYKLGGKQFWDGRGWIEITAATTDGLVPTPSPDPARYVVVTINGYGAPNADGAVRIPKTTIDTQEPSTFENFIVGDVYFNRITGEQWVLCEVNGSLEWKKGAGGGSGESITIDDEPTRGSDNPISSNAVWNIQEAMQMKDVPQGNISVRNGQEFNVVGSGKYYYIVNNNVTLSLSPAMEINEIGLSPCWVIFVHIKANINISTCHLVDPLGRTIVTNKSSVAYASSISLSELGIDNKWQAIKVRIMKNTTGEQIIHLEV